MARKYHILTYADRVNIEKMLKEDIPVVKIAEEIGMTRHAIYAELRRNGKSDNKKLYSADEAQKQLPDKCVHSKVD